MLNQKSYIEMMIFGKLQHINFLQLQIKVTTMSPNYTLASSQNDNGENVGRNSGEKMLGENIRADVGANENNLALVIPYTIEGKQNLNAYLMGYYDKK